MTLLEKAADRRPRPSPPWTRCWPRTSTWEAPVDYSTYLVGRMVASAVSPEFGVPGLQPGRDRGYAWQCWDWDRHHLGRDPGRPGAAASGSACPTSPPRRSRTSPTPSRVRRRSTSTPTTTTRARRTPPATPRHPVVRPDLDLAAHYLDRAGDPRSGALGDDPCHAQPGRSRHELELGLHWERADPRTSGPETESRDSDADERDAPSAARTPTPSSAPTRATRLRDPDPGWRPDPHQAEEWRDMAAELGRERRPRREDVYPYLFIRAVTWATAGRPTWPPTPCWESPDLLLIDAPNRGPSTPTGWSSRRSPVAPTGSLCGSGTSGCCPPSACTSRPGRSIPASSAPVTRTTRTTPEPVGGRWINLTDRTRRGLHRAWSNSTGPGTSTRARLGHHCLLAEVGCPLDPAGGLLLSNADRHVGQRNLKILAGTADAKELFAMLGNLVPEKFTLELTHAGPAAAGTLIALGGGRLPDGRGEFREVQVPTLKEIPVGVSTGTVVHLLTAFTEGGRTVVAPSTWLAEASGVRPGGSREGAAASVRSRWGYAAVAAATRPQSLVGRRIRHRCSAGRGAAGRAGPDLGREQPRGRGPGGAVGWPSRQPPHASVHPE